MIASKNKITFIRTTENHREAGLLKPKNKCLSTTIDVMRKAGVKEVEILLVRL
jgi:hypothetical protein